MVSFEQLVPLFDGDERRAILLLQHALGGVLERPYELMFGTLSERDDPAVSGLRAERTSLLSLEDDKCTFTVLETDDPLAEYTDKLDQRFTGAQE